MLGKLLKYDLKWVYKVVGVFYILAIVFSVLGRVFKEIENSAMFSVIASITLGIAISMMVSSLINCLMRLWVRFVKNMYKDESYLTHTLPVEKSKIYLSKVLAAFITIFTTVFVIFLCVCICYYTEANLEAIKGMLEIAATTYNTTVLKLLALVTFVFFLEVMFVVLIGYVGIILGHKFNTGKMIKTLVISFGLYFAIQTISLAVAYIYGLIDPEVMNIINTKEQIGIDAIKHLMYAGVGIYLIYIIILYTIGIKTLKKGVNVE